MHRHLSLLLILLLPALLLGQEKARTNTVGIEFVLVPAGSFTMGKFAPTCAPAGTQDNVTEVQYQECVKQATAATRPGFKADVPRAFYISKYEVTQEQYQKVMGKNPSYHTAAIVGGPSEKYPVDSVSWQDVQDFVKKLNSAEKTTAYRLPTELEWEYAAFAGTGNDTQGDKIQSIAWFMSNAKYITHPVGTLAPNPWGIHDMLGNVWEWVQDWYDYDTVPKGPKGPSKGTEHVLKGGGFQAHQKNVRVSVHAGGPGSVICTGIRLLMEAR